VIAAFSTQAFLTTWFAVAIGLCAPLLLGALGEVINENAGMINIGFEGLMLIGALGAFLGSSETGSAWIGLVIGIAATAGLGSVFALIYLRLRINQIVGGIIIDALAIGLTDYIYTVVSGSNTSLVGAPMIGTWRVPLLADIPIVGKALFDQNPFVYLCGPMVLLTGYILYHTSLGLQVRAAGQNPLAGLAAGVRIFRVRLVGFTISSAAAGLAGSAIMLTQLGIFRDDIIAGNGFIVLAIVIFGRWSPYKAVAAALFFSLAQALQLSLQVFSLPVPSQVFLALPYLLTAIAMSGLLGRAKAPAAFSELLST
jgi:simple sugar transport system permease protein